MEKFANFISHELGIEESESSKNYAGNTDRYAVYKAGPVLSVSVSNSSLLRLNLNLL